MHQAECIFISYVEHTLCLRIGLNLYAYSATNCPQYKNLLYREDAIPVPGYHVFRAMAQINEKYDLMLIFLTVMLLACQSGLM